MKSVNIIIPYFGRFPNYYQLFLNSCRHNPTINWTIVTDDKSDYLYPENVSVVHMEFNELVDRIQNCFEFEIELKSVHKLCEFKPAYGYIFKDLVKGFDYWGYGDLDLLYGDIRRFITEDVLKYDKIFTLGHLSLIKNTSYNNELFMSPIDGALLYKEAFSNSNNYNFDEDFMGKPNINTIFRYYGCKIWNKRFDADIYTKSSHLILDTGDGKKEKIKNSLFVWNRGKLIRFVKGNNIIKNREYLYIHFQKRKMKVNIQNDVDVFKIIPNSFDNLSVPVECIPITFDQIKKYRINLQYFRVRYRNLITKIKNFETEK